MSEKIEKMHDSLYTHYKGTLIAVLCCVCVIATGLYTGIPNIVDWVTYNQIISEADSEQSGADNDLFEGGSVDVDLADTEEYKQKETETEEMNTRVQEINDNLLSTLRGNISDFSEAYTSYSVLQSPANQEALKSYVTDEYYETLCSEDPVKLGDNAFAPYASYAANLDADSVQVYCESRTGVQYIVTETKPDGTGWRISNVQFIKVPS